MNLADRVSSDMKDDPKRILKTQQAAVHDGTHTACCLYCRLLRSVSLPE